MFSRWPPGRVGGGVAHPCEARVGLGVASRLRSVLHQEVSFRKRAPRSALQAALEFLREMFFRQRNVRRQVPRFELIGVNRFSAAVFCEALPQIAGGADVGLARKILAPEDISVILPPSLPSSFGGLGTARLRLPDWICEA